MKGIHKKILFGAVLLIGVAFTIAAVIIYFLTQSAYPKYKEGMELKRWIDATLRDADHINAEWRKTFGSLEDYAKKYPAKKINESAKSVESFAKELGAASAYADDATTLPPDSREAAFIKIANHLNEFTQGQLARPDAAFDDLPADLREYLLRSRGTLDKLVQTLIIEPHPSWEIDAERGTDAPVPPLKMHIRLQRLMMLLAIQEFIEGRHEDSFRVLDASWKLNQGLRTHSDSLTRMLSFSVERWQLGFFRKIRAMPEGWRDRVASSGVREMMRELFVSNAYYNKMAFIEARAEGEKQLDQIPVLRKFKKLIKALPNTGNQYFDAASLDLLRVETQAYSHFESLDACSLTGDGFMDRLVKKSEKFNIFIPAVIFLQKDANRLNRYTLDRELTLKVVQIEQARDRTNRNWRAAIPGIESSTCQDAHWIYEVSPDQRTMKIHYSKKMEWPGQKGLMLPMEYSATIPAGK